MSKISTLILVVVFAGIFMQFTSSNHSALEPASTGTTVVILEDTIPTEASLLPKDTLYRWDDSVMNWVIDENAAAFQQQLANGPTVTNHSSGAIAINWKSLLDIRYKLRYFEELGTEIFSPVFNPSIAALDGKEVVIEGYIIPFAEAGELLSLSFGPYTSCYFCGEGSPASIISVYTKEESKRYMMDDRKKFSGILQLNYNDPNEFYYVLREAEEE